MSIEPMLPERITVPFPNYDLWNSAEASGRIHGHRDGLTLEFEAVEYDPDGWWAEVKGRSGVREMEIPLAEIESLELRQGRLETKIELSVRSMKTLEGVPGGKQGKILLSVPDKSRDAVKDLVATMKVRLSQNALERLNP